MNKLNIVLFTLFLSYTSYAQLNYNINKFTGQISNVNHYVHKFSKLYTFDMDFQERRSEVIDFQSRVAFNLDESGEGELILYTEGDGKFYLHINVCIERTYKDSVNKYWEFFVVKPDGKIVSFYLDFENNVIDKFFFERENNERVYYTN